MKIENIGNGQPPLSSKPTDASSRVEKKDDRKDTQPIRVDQDKAVMSDNARILAKARAALGNVEDPNTDRVAMLKEQIAAGNYTIQVNELARRLVARFYPK